jgi:hypothetical protein
MRKGKMKKESCVFGYGSLVNAYTNAANNDIFPATLYGFHREWSHCVQTSFGDVRALTLQPSNQLIFGGIRKVNYFESLKLDEREQGYNRFYLANHHFQDKRPECSAIYTYVSDNKHYNPQNKDFPILMSYLVTVLCGHFFLFGKQGLRNFFMTTYGWAAPLINDLSSPIYPRYDHNMLAPIWEDIRFDVQNLLADVRGT